jgi:hypothetical protein
MTLAMPILTQIENSLAEAISSIKQSNGYYNDWGSINEPDVAKQDFPSAEIILESEECLDETTGAWSQSYNQEATFLIQVRACNDNEEDIPVYEINKKLNSALEDLKKLFGTFYTISGNCELIMYRGSLRMQDPNNDIFRPSYLHTRWLIKYTQDRKNPSSFM